VAQRAPPNHIPLRLGGQLRRRTDGRPAGRSRRSGPRPGPTGHVPGRAVAGRGAGGRPEPRFGRGGSPPPNRRTRPGSPGADDRGEPDRRRPAQFGRPRDAGTDQPGAAERERAPQAGRAAIDRAGPSFGGGEPGIARPKGTASRAAGRADDGHRRAAEREPGPGDATRTAPEAAHRAGGNQQGVARRQRGARGSEGADARPAGRVDGNQRRPGRGHRPRRSGQSRQKPVPRKHEPRDSHAHERGDWHDGVAARNEPLGRAGRFRRDDPHRGGGTIGVDQRHSGLLQDRVRTRSARKRSLRPARLPRVRPRSVPSGNDEGPRSRIHDRRQRADGGGGRSVAPAAGAGEPGRQRREVHRARTGNRPGHRATP